MSPFYSCYWTVTSGEKKMEIHSTLRYSLAHRSATYQTGQRSPCLECYAVSVQETPVIGWQMFGCDEWIQPNYLWKTFFFFFGATYVTGSAQKQLAVFCFYVGERNAQCTQHYNTACKGLNVPVKWVTFLFQIPHISCSNLDAQIRFRTYAGRNNSWHGKGCLCCSH